MSANAQRELLAGRYRLGDLIGAGGTGEVRRAWDTVFNRPVAVKLVGDDADEATRRRVAHEVRTAAALEHPGVVWVLDGGTDGSRAFVVMRLIDGGTLHARIAHGAMDVGTVRELGRRLAEALDHVHGHGIVHRDVTPANILLDGQARPHLADFGLAHRPGDLHHAGADQLIGTAAYLAPEQVRGDEVTPATDIYALGLVLLECLTGHREFEGGPAEAALARLNRPPRIPSDLPADLARLLASMTSLDPRRRPTAATCAQTLRDRETPLAVHAPTRKPNRSRRRRSALQLSIAGPLTAALTTLFVLPAARLAEPPPTSPPSTTTPTTFPQPAATTTVTPVVIPTTTVRSRRQQVDEPPHTEPNGPDTPDPDKTNDKKGSKSPPGVTPPRRPQTELSKGGGTSPGT